MLFPLPHATALDTTNERFKSLFNAIDGVQDGEIVFKSFEKLRKTIFEFQIILLFSCPLESQRMYTYTQQQTKFYFQLPVSFFPSLHEKQSTKSATIH